MYYLFKHVSSPPYTDTSLLFSCIVSEEMFYVRDACEIYEYRHDLIQYNI